MTIFNRSKGNKILQEIVKPYNSVHFATYKKSLGRVFVTNDITDWNEAPKEDFPLIYLKTSNDLYNKYFLSGDNNNVEQLFADEREFLFKNLLANDAALKILGSSDDDTIAQWDLLRLIKCFMVKNRDNSYLREQEHALMKMDDSFKMIHSSNYHVRLEELLYAQGKDACLAHLETIKEDLKSKYQLDEVKKPVVLLSNGNNSLSKNALKDLLYQSTSSFHLNENDSVQWFNYTLTPVVVQYINGSLVGCELVAELTVYSEDHEFIHSSPFYLGNLSLETHGYENFYRSYKLAYFPRGVIETMGFNIVRDLKKAHHHVYQYPHQCVLDKILDKTPIGIEIKNQKKQLLPFETPMELLVRVIEDMEHKDEDGNPVSFIESPTLSGLFRIYCELWNNDNYIQIGYQYLNIAKDQLFGNDPTNNNQFKGVVGDVMKLESRQNSNKFVINTIFNLLGRKGLVYPKWSNAIRALKSLLDDHAPNPHYLLCELKNKGHHAIVEQLTPYTPKVINAKNSLLNADECFSGDTSFEAYTYDIIRQNVYYVFEPDRTQNNRILSETAYNLLSKYDTTGELITKFEERAKQNHNIELMDYFEHIKPDDGGEENAVNRVLNIINHLNP